MLVRQAERSQQIEQRLPEPAVKIENDARARVAEMVEIAEHGQDVVEMDGQVGKDDVIELSVRPSERFGGLFMKFKLGMTCPCRAQHLATDVHAHAARRVQRGK